jgi:4,4'-diaponeurosporenoate glycosyltransferase
MTWLATFCLLGFLAGFLLLRRVPSCRSKICSGYEAISLIVPARNEENNLPSLLGSIRESECQPAEVIVVDDASTDATASVAEEHGAAVLRSHPLPTGWTGKNWSCYQGAQHASADVLLFLDADAWFSPQGFEHIANAYCIGGDGGIAMSVLPYHVVRKPYEELSLFFNLLMAMGAGGFGWLGAPRLFGQSLIISRDLYNAGGGHEAVSKTILENLALSARFERAGGRCICYGGRGVLNVRMFPDGFTQLCEGWTKAFADGAAASGATILLVSIFWLTAMCTCFFAVLLADGMWQVDFGVMYILFAVQLLLFARQIGNFSPIACLLYPLPLFFYFALFGRSLYRKLFRRSVSWRGRTL